MFLIFRIYFTFYTFQDNIEQGMFFIIYEQKSLQDFLHVENLAQGHELAAKALTKERNFIAVGTW